MCVISEKNSAQSILTQGTKLPLVLAYRQVVFEAGQVEFLMIVMHLSNLLRTTGISKTGGEFENVHALLTYCL